MDRALVFTFAVALAACSPIHAPASASVETSATSPAGENPLPLPPPRPPPPPPPPPLPPPRAPASTADCPFHWTPKDLGASVIRIPSAVAGRFMNPLHDAACACVRPGERVAIAALIVPERGAIEARTGERDEPETRADPSIDACLTEVLGKVFFEPFELGSDVVCPEPTPPPPKKGPPFFRAPRLAACPEPGARTSKITYPLLIDRTTER